MSLSSSWMICGLIRSSLGKVSKYSTVRMSPSMGCVRGVPTSGLGFVLRYLDFVVADRLAEAVDVRCASAIRGSSITFARHRWEPTHPDLQS